ncbi:hypothetical protein K2Y11_08285 [bacterium]|nr:hypothetical protein [bacterium]
MTMTPEEIARLDDYRFMRGPVGGNLAFLLDRLTDVMAIIAMHKVYCRIEKGPHAGEASLDVQEALDALQDAKDLIQQSMRELSPPTA